MQIFILPCECTEVSPMNDYHSVFFLKWSSWQHVLRTHLFMYPVYLHQMYKQSWVLPQQKAWFMFETSQGHDCSNKLPFTSHTCLFTPNKSALQYFVLHWNPVCKEKSWKDDCPVNVWTIRTVFRVPLCDCLSTLHSDAEVWPLTCLAGCVL